MFKDPAARAAFFEKLKQNNSPGMSVGGVQPSPHMQMGAPHLPSVGAIQRPHLPNVPGQVSSALGMEQPNRFQNLSKYLKGV